MADRDNGPQREDKYTEIVAAYGPAIERLARAYESDADKCRDLLQEIHLALWRSLATFDGRCSLRTWVYRIAHNTAISQIVRRRAAIPPLVGLDEIDPIAIADEAERTVDAHRVRERLMALVQSLKPLDREVFVLYLEGEDAAAIGEITGLSPSNVATKVHRLKQILRRRVHEGRP